jgi:hypothetical protein
VGWPIGLPHSTHYDKTLVSALAGFIALLGFVDDVNAAFAAHELIVAMTTTQRFQGVADLHQTNPTGSLKENIGARPICK